MSWFLAQALSSPWYLHPVVLPAASGFLGVIVGGLIAAGTAYLLDQRRESRDKRQKIAIVSQMLADWISSPKNLEQLTAEQRNALNRLSFEAALWLPSELVIALNKRLRNQSDAKSTGELLLLARKELTGDSSLKSGHVTYW